METVKPTAENLRVAEHLVRSFTPKWNRFMPVKPHPKQHLFLLLDDVYEVLFGGAGGGGKSIGILLAALQYVDVPGYSALLLRRTYPELSKAGALMDVASGWLMGREGVKWADKEKSYFFDTGPGNKAARLQFGYLENEKDKYQYQSAEYQFIGFDELTEFEESQYTFLFSRLRKSKNIEVPLRMRGSTNPGGTGHDWVKARFPVDRERKEDEPSFIPAKIDDNPSLDAEAYEHSLSHLLLPDRQRIRDGRWDVIEGGSIFSLDWMADKFIDAAPSDTYTWIRWWDLAGTSDKSNAATASVLMGKTTKKEIIIGHAVEFWKTTGNRDDAIKAQAEADGKTPRIGIEEEPGSGGIAQCDSLIKQLMGWRVIAERPESAKVARGIDGKFMRFGPFASYAERGLVKIVRGPWAQTFLAFLHQLTLKSKRLDWMDAASGAFQYLANIPIPSTAPKQVIPTDETNWRNKFVSQDWRGKFKR